MTFSDSLSETQGLKLIFAGTPEFAAHHLQALIDSKHQVVAVYTQPDRPSGRGKKLTPSPVKQLALTHQLSVEQPLSLKEASAQQTLEAYQADVMIVVAYGLLLPQAVLDTPLYGCLNVHGSILPRWRGAAPIQRAVEAGDSCSGITIMQMDKGLDTGDMLLKVDCPIDAKETSASLHDKLMELGPPALLETLQRLQNQQLTPEKQQDTLACYAEKISKQEAMVNWEQAALTIDRKIRAFNPFPTAYTFLNGERIKIHQTERITSTHNKPVGEVIRLDDNGILVACGDKQDICIKKIQLPGKKAMLVKELLNGYSDWVNVGDRFSSSQ